MTDLLRHQLKWYRTLLPIAEAPDSGAKIWVDVGANIGEISEFFWRANPYAKEIWSFEPLTENIAQIEERREQCLAQVSAEGTDASLISKIWNVRTQAVSDHDGVVKLRVQTDNSGMHNSRVTMSSASSREISCCRLRSVVEHAEVVKLDIEGHEYPVLEDSLAKLDRVMAWALELHSVQEYPLQDVLAALESQSFRLFAATQKRGDRSGTWHSQPIDRRLTWDHIPAAKQTPGEPPFKMLHVIARRFPK